MTSWMTRALWAAAVVAAAPLFGAPLFGAAPAAADATPGCGGLYEKKCAPRAARFDGKAKKLACPKGTVFSPRKGGECWRCPKDYTRNWLRKVVHAKACKRGAARAPARFVRTVWGCGRGQFFALARGGSCWTCPNGYKRNAPMLATGGKACRPRKACDPTLKAQKGACVFSAAKKVKADGEKKLKAFGHLVVDAVRLARDAATTPGLLKGLRKKDPEALRRFRRLPTYPQVETRARENLFRTFSAGARAGVVVVGGVSGELGFAFDISGAKRPAAPFAGGSWRVTAGVSLDGGGNFGFWRGDNASLGSPSHGALFSVTALMRAVKAAKGVGSLKDFKKGPSFAVGVWFDDDFRFKGFTVTPGVGAGLGFTGVTYARGQKMRIGG